MANIVPIKTHIKTKLIQCFKQLDFWGVTSQMNQTFKAQQHAPVIKGKC